MSKEHLLREDFEDDEEAVVPNYSAPKHRSMNSLTVKSMFAVIIFLLASNIFLLIRYQKVEREHKPILEGSKYGTVPLAPKNTR